MLTRRLRRRPNIERALGQHLVSVVLLVDHINRRREREDSVARGYNTITKSTNITPTKKSFLFVYLVIDQCQVKMLLLSLVFLIRIYKYINLIVPGCD